MAGNKVARATPTPVVAMARTSLEMPVTLVSPLPWASIDDDEVVRARSKRARSGDDIGDAVNVPDLD